MKIYHLFAFIQNFSSKFLFYTQASKLDSDSDVEIVNGDEEMESEEDD